MLLVADTERVLAYNSTAHDIWCALRRDEPPAQVAAALAARFALESAVAVAAVDTIVAHWRAEGLFAATPAIGASGPSASVPQRHSFTREPVWARTWTCRLGDHFVELAVDHAAAATLLAGPLAPCVMTAAAPSARVEVRTVAEGELLISRDGRARRRVAGRYGLKEGVYLALLETLWPDREVDTLVHAGAVARGGRSVCLAATSGRGKTTLVAHLLSRGYDYVTDDLSALDVGGDVLPLPTRMSVKEGSWGLLASAFPSLETTMPGAGPRTQWLAPPLTATPPSPLAALVFPTYGAGRPVLLQAIRPLESFMRLQEAGVWLGHPLTEARVTRLARRLETVPAYALDYGDLDDAAAAIDRLLPR